MIEYHYNYHLHEYRKKICFIYGGRWLVMYNIENGILFSIFGFFHAHLVKFRKLQRSGAGQALGYTLVYTARGTLGHTPGIYP